MNIGEVAGLSGVSQRMVRHYEAIGLLPAPARRRSGYRDYGPSDLARLRFVANARDLGFPIDEIRALLSLWADRDRSSAEVKRLALDRAAELGRKADLLAQMSASLQQLAERCHGDARPDCPIIDKLADKHGPGSIDMAKHATLYRMVMPEHVCPYGIKSKWQLERHGYVVDDHWLRTKEETDTFKAVQHVKTTPQTFVDGQRIGGNDDLTRFFGGHVRESGETSYRPVLTLFAITACLALAASWSAFGTPFTGMALSWFVSFSMAVLAMLKLQDVERFSTMFLNYDLLARRWVPYAYMYPFLEAAAGTLMAAGVLRWISIPIALVIGGIGAISVFKAVYIDRRQLKCACVGGSTNVPLGFVSLTENLFMIGTATWMLLQWQPLAGM